MYQEINYNSEVIFSFQKVSMTSIWETIYITVIVATQTTYIIQRVDHGCCNLLMIAFMAEDGFTCLIE